MLTIDLFLIFAGTFCLAMWLVFFFHVWLERDSLRRENAKLIRRVEILNEASVEEFFRIFKS